MFPALVQKPPPRRRLPPQAGPPALGATGLLRAPLGPPRRRCTARGVCVWGGGGLGGGFRVVGPWVWVGLAFGVWVGVRVWGFCFLFRVGGGGVGSRVRRGCGRGFLGKKRGDWNRMC